MKLEDASYIDNSTSVDGNAGTVRIIADQTELSNGSSIQTNSEGQGDSGKLNIISTQVTLDHSRISAENASPNQNSIGGKVTVATNNLNMKDYSAISVVATANGGSKTETKGTLRVEPLLSGDRNLISLDHSDILANTTGQGQGGDVSITADQVALTNNSRILATTEETATGQGGNIGINANSVHLKDSFYIAAPTLGPGMGGNVEITAKDITLENNSQIAAFTTSTGNAQGVTITTDTLNVKESAIAVGTIGSGEGGHLTLSATKEAILSGQGSTTDENGMPLFAISVDSRGSGNMSETPTVITTPKLTLKDDAVISAATFGSGRGGNLQINANNLLVTNSNIVATTVGSGRGGNIDIQTEKFELFGKSSNVMALERKITNLDVSAKDLGNAGSLTIKPFPGKTSPSIYLHDATIRSATEGQGQGGDLSIQASTLTLDNNSQIDAGTTSTGMSGRIRIIADATTDEGIVKILNGSAIQAKTSGEGDAQYVQIQAKTIELDTNAKISAKTEKGKGGKAGKINIFTLANEGLVSLKNNSTIEVSTESPGEGGNLTKF